MSGLRSESSGGSGAHRFDVFLSYHSPDRPLVRKLKQRLVAARLSVWFDEDELPPGQSWQDLIEEGIRGSKCVAVLVGPSGIGPWEDEEAEAALQFAVRERRSVIPVLLPGCDAAPRLPMFLSTRTWVDLHAGLRQEGIERLLWGITGVKPESNGVSDWAEPAAPPDEPGFSAFPEPAAPPEPASLIQVLPGAWQVQIQSPFQPGLVAQARLQLLPNGLFQGQLIDPMGMTSALEGQWQANPIMNQIGLQGMQSNGLLTVPYVALVQVSECGPQRIVGVTNAGEQVTFQRIGR